MQPIPVIFRVVHPMAIFQLSVHAFNSTFSQIINQWSHLCGLFFRKQPVLAFNIFSDYCCCNFGADITLDFIIFESRNRVFTTIFATIPKLPKTNPVSDILEDRPSSIQCDRHNYGGIAPTSFYPAIALNGHVRYITVGAVPPSVPALNRCASKTIAHFP